MDNDFLKTLKDLFKTRKRLKEEEAQAVYDALKNEKDTVARLAELEKEYEESRPKETAPDFDEMFKPVKYDRVSYDLLSDEEIEKKAAEQGNAEYVGKISDVNKKTYDKLVSLEIEKRAAAEKKAASFKEIDALLSELSESAKNRAIKNGVARGSILENATAALSDSATDDKRRVEAAFLNTVEKIDEKTAALEKERETALENLDIGRAVEINETIDKLKKERDKLKASEIAANVAIEKKEKDENLKIESEKAKFIENYDKTRRTAEKEEAAYEKANGYSGEKLRNYAERYNVALSFYMSLDPDVAPKALEASANMKQYLGNNYDKLLNLLKSRATTKSKKYI